MMIAPAEADALKDKAFKLAQLQAPTGYLAFLDHIMVDAQPVKKPYRTIAEGWQWERALRAKDALEHLAGVTPPGSYMGPLSFWNEYHKGSDKTHDTAREIIWLLAFSRRRLNMFVCAGDQEQAGLITAAMTGTMLDNPWLEDYVRVTKLTAKGSSGSELTVMPMDAYSGQGVFPDYMVAEEVTHWQHDEGRMFWDFVLSSVNKRPSCILKVNTNAGHRGSWQWEERKRIKESKFWSFYSAPEGKPLPSWMNQEKINDDAKGMDPGERKRLYENKWVDPGEERGYLTLEESEKCIDHELIELGFGKRGTEYFASIDYGGVSDRASLCVLHTVPGTDRAVIDRLDCWQGSHDNRLDINIPEDDPNRRSIEGWLEMVLARFRIGMLVVDPAQLEGLAIKYERKGVWVQRFEFMGGKNNHRMAQLLKTSVQNRKITWSPMAGILPEKTDAGKIIEDRSFAQELSMLITKPMSYGYRFDHESGRHDDRACAVGMALVYAFPETAPAGGQGPKMVPPKPGHYEPPSKSGIPAVPQKSYAEQWNVFGAGRNQRR